MEKKTKVGSGRSSTMRRLRRRIADAEKEDGEEEEDVRCREGGGRRGRRGGKGHNFGLKSICILIHM